MISQLNNYMQRIGRGQSLTPSQIAKYFSDYVEMSEATPLYRQEAIKSGNLAGTTFSLPMKRALSIKGFCLTIGITNARFMGYLNPETKEYADYHEICEFIRDYIDNDTYEAAMGGLVNGNIAANMLRKAYDLVDERESLQALNVGKIEHQITFNDFKSLAPVPDDPLSMIKSRANDAQDAQVEYDSLPPGKSSQLGLDAMNARNNVAQDTCTDDRYDSNAQRY